MQYSFVAVGAVLAVSAQAAVVQSIPEYSSSVVVPVYVSTPIVSATPVAYSSSTSAQDKTSSATPVAYSSSTAAPSVSSKPVPVYTTEVVTALTTYCPYATQLTHGGVTYTVTSATTLTITNCPCTITKSSVPTAPVYSSSAATSVPVYSSSAVSSAVSSAPVVSKPTVSSATVVSKTTVAPVLSSATAVVPPPVYQSTLTSVTSGKATGAVGTTTAAVTPKVTPSATKPAAFTGAANKLSGAGAMLAGVAGVVAYIL